MGTTSSPSPASGGTPDFTIVLRGYERTQVDMYIQRLHARIDELTEAASKAKNGTSDARERIAELERKVAEQAKQLEERAQPTLSGLGTRVEPRLMIVGHDPAFTDLVRLLLIGSTGPPIGLLRKGGIAAFAARPDGRFLLDWFARPKLIRRLAK